MFYSRNPRVGFTHPRWAQKPYCCHTEPPGQAWTAGGVSVDENAVLSWIFVFCEIGENREKPDAVIRTRLCSNFGDRNVVVSDQRHRQWSLSPYNAYAGARRTARTAYSIIVVPDGVLRNVILFTACSVRRTRNAKTTRSRFTHYFLLLHDY